jgi:hypothetical protein
LQLRNKVCEGFFDGTGFGFELCDLCDEARVLFLEAFFLFLDGVPSTVGFEGRSLFDDPELVVGVFDFESVAQGEVSGDAFEAGEFWVESV